MRIFPADSAPSLQIPPDASPRPQAEKCK